MHFFKKKGKIKRFKNLKGHFIDLYIVHKGPCLSVVIQNCNHYRDRKIVLCSLFVFSLVICCILHILPHRIVIVLCFISIVIIIIFSTTVRESNICGIYLKKYKYNIKFLDNLLIVNGLGIQINVIYLLHAKTVFIPFERVQRIFINEVLLQVKNYML